MADFPVEVDALPPGAVLLPPPVQYDLSYDANTHHAQHVAPPAMSMDEEHDFGTPSHDHVVTFTRNRPGRWKNGICGCHCDGGCCISFWLSDLQNVKLHSLLDNDRPPRLCKGTFLPVFYFVCLALSLIFSFASSARLYYLLPVPGVLSVAIIALRVHTRIRAAREIDVHETCCDSCCCAFWCSPCSTVQMTDSFVAAGEPEARLFH